MPSAFSMSPPDSVSAVRQSSTPAPVLSRSSLTAAADTLMLCSLPSFVSLLMYNTAPLPAARCARRGGPATARGPRLRGGETTGAAVPGCLRLREDPACGEGKCLQAFSCALRCRDAG